MNTIRPIFSLKVWTLLIASSAFAFLFQRSYCTSVCPYIDGLPPSELTKTLLIMTGLHIVIRFILYIAFNKKWENYTVYRQAYILSVLSWVLIGIIAALIHEYLYTSFPISSHLKMLSGYWLIGGGIFAQLEYLVYEMAFKKIAPKMNLSVAQTNKENLARRILEGYMVFTIVPIAMMVLIVSRYYYEMVLQGHLFAEVIYISAITLVSSMIVAVLIGRLLNQDTESIIADLLRIQQGDLKHKLQITRGDELGKIASGITLMKEGLEQKEVLRNVLYKFVDPNVAQKFMQKQEESNITELGGQDIETAILMCDIRNFTPLSETLEPKMTVEMLNDYFEIMVETIGRHNGMIDKYMGDAIMAVFGVGDDVENKERNALTAAREMIANLTPLNATLATKNLPPIKIGIGLHVGTVIAGYLGTQNRLEYTVVGAAVNTTARIEAQAKAPYPPLLFSDTFNQRVKNEFDTCEVASVQLKGMSESMQMHSLRELA